MNKTMANNELVKSLMKGLDILQAASRSEDGVSLQDIANGLGMKLPTAHNLVRTLAARQFLERKGKPVRYGLGISAVELGEGYRRRVFLVNAKAVMRELDGRLPSATITLAELVSGEVTVTLRLSPELPGQFEYPVDRKFSPYSSISSLVFQAFLNERQRESFRRRYPFYEYGGHLWKSIESLDAFLKKVVRAGYAYPEFLCKDGSLRLAVPVFDSGKSIRATIGICLREGRPSQAERKAYIKEVLKAGRRLSSQDDRL